MSSLDMHETKKLTTVVRMRKVQNTAQCLSVPEQVQSTITGLNN